MFKSIILRVTIKPFKGKIKKEEVGKHLLILQVKMKQNVNVGLPALYRDSTDHYVLKKMKKTICNDFWNNILSFLSFVKSGNSKITWKKNPQNKAKHVSGLRFCFFITTYIH